mmetsp:Transcript_15018/g.42645  ORF Transcript_15018/g.42645 Transcript_15018/m.42645 type:complete len:229 (+) Transcript_15018:423-1109(+)
MFSTHAMPSSSALCASMGPSITSPKAKTEGTLVRKCSSTWTRPSLSVSMPRFSSPSPSVKGRRPVATRTTSKWSVVASPPFAGACVSATPSSATSADCTAVLSLNFMPCFLSSLRKVLPTSLSVPGTMWSRNSITVTLVPSRRQTEPISRPITPPPITAMVFGISFRSKAPVESTMRPPALSTGHGGSGETSDPVASKMWAASSVSAPPSFNATPTLFGPWSVPLPCR